MLSYEFRYPAGQYLLSVPAGLIDEEDREKPDVLVSTAIREIREETGLEVRDTDTVRVVNPLVFSTPGLQCADLRRAAFRQGCRSVPGGGRGLRAVRRVLPLDQSPGQRAAEKGPG